MTEYTESQIPKDEEMIEAVADLEWNGRMIEFFPGDGYRTSDILGIDVWSDIFDSIYEHNNTDNFEEGLHIGEVFFYEDGSYYVDI